MHRPAGGVRSGICGVAQRVVPRSEALSAALECAIERGAAARNADKRPYPGGIDLAEKTQEKIARRRIDRALRFRAARSLSMGQRACLVSAKEIYQTKLYLGDSFRIGKPRHLVLSTHNPSALT